MPLNPARSGIARSNNSRSRFIARLDRFAGLTGRFVWILFILGSLLMIGIVASADDTKPMEATLTPATELMHVIASIVALAAAGVAAWVRITVRADLAQFENKMSGRMNGLYLRKDGGELAIINERLGELRYRIVNLEAERKERCKEEEGHE